MAEKIYCGKGKKSNYGIKLNICIDDIPPEYISTFKDKRYIRLELSEMRNVDQRGNTHTVTVYTWKPDGARQAPPINNAPQNSSYDPNDPNSLPF